MKSIAKPNNLTFNQPSVRVTQKGWEALNRTIGPTEALRFVMSLTVGQGDSVKFFKDIWEHRSIEEIHREILKTKEKKEI